MGEFLLAWLCVFLAMVIVIGGFSIIAWVLEWIINKLPVGNKARDGIGLTTVLIIMSFFCAVLLNIEIK